MKKPRDRAVRDLDRLRPSSSHRASGNPLGEGARSTHGTNVAPSSINGRSPWLGPAPVVSRTRRVYPGSPRSCRAPARRPGRTSASSSDPETSRTRCRTRRRPPRTSRLVPRDQGSQRSCRWAASFPRRPKERAGSSERRTRRRRSRQRRSQQTRPGRTSAWSPAMGRCRRSARWRSDCPSQGRCTSRRPWLPSRTPAPAGR